MRLGPRKRRNNNVHLDTPVSLPRFLGHGNHCRGVVDCLAAPGRTMKPIIDHVKATGYADKCVDEAMGVCGCDVCNLARAYLDLRNHNWKPDTHPAPDLDIPTFLRRKPNLRACGQCGKPCAPIGVDWPYWIEGKPVCDVCAWFRRGELARGVVK